MLENMAPAELSGKRPWMIHYLNSIKHGLLVVTGRFNGKMVARLLSEGSQLTRKDGDPAIYTIPSDPESLAKLSTVIGNLAIALFELVSLVYISNFWQEPNSLPVNSILADLYPSAQPKATNRLPI